MQIKYHNNHAVRYEMIEKHFLMALALTHEENQKWVNKKTQNKGNTYRFQCSKMFRDIARLWILAALLLVLSFLILPVKLRN